MKNTILSALVILAATIANAKVVKSEQLTVAPSDVEKVIRLVNKKDSGSSYKKLQILVTDTGMSTDVSPRYGIYLGFASLAEMGNITVSFLVNDQAYEFISATRKSAGIYEVKTVEYRDDGMYNVTQTIDATKVFSDEKALRKSCGGDFCDTELKSTISISEVATKI